VTFEISNFADGGLVSDAAAFIGTILVKTNIVIIKVIGILLCKLNILNTPL
jgi:hypothetical protein